MPGASLGAQSVVTEDGMAKAGLLYLFDRCRHEAGFGCAAFAFHTAGYLFLFMKSRSFLHMLRESNQIYAVGLQSMI